MATKRYPVTEKKASLKKQAQAIGCDLVIQPHEFMPYSTIAIIPDNPTSRKRLAFGVADGAVLVLVDHSDMDKKAKNSRYYKALEKLEDRFREMKAHLSELAVSYNKGHPLSRHP